MSLPPFPTDAQTLDLVWSAIHPDPDMESGSSLFATLRMLSELGGSDIDAIAEQHGDNAVELRDPQYHEHDLIAALITEIRRVREVSVALVEAVLSLHSPEPGWAVYYSDKDTAWNEASCAGCQTRSSTVAVKNCRTRKAINEAVKP